MEAPAELYATGDKETQHQLNVWDFEGLGIRSLLAGHSLNHLASKTPPLAATPVNLLQIPSFCLPAGWQQNTGLPGLARRGIHGLGILLAPFFRNVLHSAGRASAIQNSDKEKHDSVEIP